MDHHEDLDLPGPSQPKVTGEVGATGQQLGGTHRGGRPQGGTQRESVGASGASGAGRGAWQNMGWSHETMGISPEIQAETMAQTMWGLLSRMAWC